MACGAASLVMHNSRGAGVGSSRTVPAACWPRHHVSMQGPLITTLQSWLARQAGVRPGMSISVCVFVCVCTAAVFQRHVPPLSRALSLTQVFEAVGPVVELVVVRDKFSHESKGSAFVWYTNKADADQVGRRQLWQHSALGFCPPSTYEVHASSAGCLLAGLAVLRRSGPPDCRLCNADHNTLCPAHVPTLRAAHHRLCSSSTCSVC